MNGANIEAVMPSSQQDDKLFDCFQRMEQCNVTKREALYAKDITISAGKHTITTNLLISVIDKKIMNVVEGSSSKDYGMFYPVRMKTRYGLKLKNQVPMCKEEQPFGFPVAGFYEDAILCQQNPEELLSVYVSKQYYDKLKEGGTFEDYLIASIQMEDAGVADQLVENLKDQLSEQLFIHGLELNLYSGQDIKESIHLYTNVVKKASLVFGFFFFAVAVIGLLCTIKRQLNENKKIGKLKIISFYFGGAGLLFGNLILVLAANPFFAYLLQSTGYSFDYKSVIACMILTTFVYVVLVGLLLVIGWHQKPDPSASLEQFNLQRKVNLAIIFSMTVIISSLCIVAGSLYRDLGENTGLYYEDTEDAIEVFYVADYNAPEGAVKERDMSPFSELIDYAKPVVSYIMLSGLILFTLIYLMSINGVLNDSIQRIRIQEKKEPRSQALSTFGWLAAAVLLGFIVAILVAAVLLPLVSTTMFSLLGVTTVIDLHLRFGVCLMILGGLVVLTGGATVVRMR